MKACENVFKLMVYQGLLIGYMVKGTKIIKLSSRPAYHLIW